jgi:hypothetical protein
MTKKHTNIFLSKALQILPKLVFFWLETTPSGNPGAGQNFAGHDLET